ncbi:hypothetical protein [Nocardiopsis dassonvillei]|uniref:hypothetical protein n=1 Tax=Nocardiopsis dassonvillei TaxID=2014 RepID=UPI00157BC741|nr:hypothetical protein [Nocardiopsis dassonvillei]
MSEQKDIQSIDTTDGVTTITYTDGSVETQHGGGTIQAGTVNGGISFGRSKRK